MTIRLAIHKLCDRCLRPFEDSSVKLEEMGGSLPKISRKTLRAFSITEGPDGSAVDTELFAFQDICPRCEEVVMGYIQRIKLESQDEEERPRRRARAEKAEAEKSVEQAAVVEVKEEVPSNGAGIEVSVVSNTVPSLF